jgi:hypothetical protein
MSLIVKTVKKVRKQFNWLIIRKESYSPLNIPEYYKRFGIVMNGQTQEYEVTKPEMLVKAYTKAWENRDFEIDKFWTRAAYFWGFIVLIFGGYITILTSEHSAKALSMHLDLFCCFLDFYSRFLGISLYLGVKVGNEIGKIT